MYKMMYKIFGLTIRARVYFVHLVHYILIKTFIENTIIYMYS